MNLAIVSAVLWCNKRELEKCHWQKFLWVPLAFDQEKLQVQELESPHI
jgi:hypothetical protein